MSGEELFEIPRGQLAAVQMVYCANTGKPGVCFFYEMSLINKVAQ